MPGPGVLKLKPPLSGYSGPYSLQFHRVGPEQEMAFPLPLIHSVPHLKNLFFPGLHPSFSDTITSCSSELPFIIIYTGFCGNCSHDIYIVCLFYVHRHKMKQIVLLCPHSCGSQDKFGSIFKSAGTSTVFSLKFCSYYILIAQVIVV